MAQILLRHELNKSVNFVKIINFVVDRRIMTLEESHKLYKQFKQGKDVVFDIRDEVISPFTDELISLHCTLD